MFHETVAIWLRKNGVQDVHRVVRTHVDKYDGGGCPTCSFTVENFVVNYVTFDGFDATYTREVSYADLIRELTEL